LIVIQEFVQIYAFTMIGILVYWDLSNKGDQYQRNEIGKYFGFANWIFFGIFVAGIVKKAGRKIRKKLYSFKDKIIK